MAAHPERLAAGALLAALALSLVFGVALRDEIACSMVDASDLTRIGPGVYARGGESADERARLLALVDDARRGVGQPTSGKRENVVIFSDSDFWRGDADARTIATPFRACVVIGSAARNVERVSLELSRAEALSPARPTAIAEAERPAKTAPAASEPKPEEASVAPARPDEPAAGAVEAGPPAEPVAAEPESHPAPAPAPGPAIAATPAPMRVVVREPVPTPPAPSRPPSLAQIPKSAPPLPSPAPRIARAPIEPANKSPALDPLTRPLSPARHIRPGPRLPEIARTAGALLAAPHIRPIAPRPIVAPAARAPALAAAPPVRIRTPGATDRIEQPEDLTRRFAEPPLSEKWSRSESIYLPRDWRRIDTPQGLLYQARQREIKGSCSTGSTNGYFPCPKADMRHTR
jgi:hypothetical protein